MADPEVVGKVGRVVTRVRGPGGPGEVVVSVRGGTEHFIAYGDEVHDLHAKVLVVHSRGQRAVDVVAWSGLDGAAVAGVAEG